MKGRAAAVLAAAVVALLATAVGTAAPGTSARGGTFSHPQSAADASKWLTPSVLAEIKAKLVAAAKSPSVSVAFQGVAYCSDNFFVEWPAYDATHDLTITIPVGVFASMPDFSDAALDIPPWYVAQSGTQFTFYDSTGAVINGPLAYQNAWSLDTFSTHPYVKVANIIWTKDNGQLSGPDVRIVDAFGPNVVSSPVCHL